MNCYLVTATQIFLLLTPQIFTLPSEQKSLVNAWHTAEYAVDSKHWRMKKVGFVKDRRVRIKPKRGFKKKVTLHQKENYKKQSV